MTEVTPSKPTLLVVDDSRLMRVAARKILNNDFEIVDAEDGDIAWDILQSNSQIALVMSDLSMPNLDGLGLLKKIRESDQPGLRDLPVIIVTGAEDDDGSKAAALSAGASDFIAKPFESVHLLARTTAQAKQQRMQQALQSRETSQQVPAEQSKFDPLTGLANKQSFMTSIEEHLAYAIRHRTELSLLALRVDKYKILFLRRGKQGAENVLRKIASLAKQGRRREDIVARISLDTFGLLLPSSNPIDAARVRDQLFHAIAQEQFGGTAAASTVRASIGLSALTIHRNVQPAELLEDALQALEAPTDRAIPRPQLPSSPDMQGPAIKADPVVASAEQVMQALHVLEKGTRPAQAADHLVRAILPVLQFWNQSNDDRYQSLIAALLKALNETEHHPSATTPAPESSVHSV